MSYRTLLATACATAALSLVATAPAHAVFFHVGSGSIDGSLCVGNDCVASEAFGFDTIRLKENNLRVHFDDTSSGSFPSNDWRLTANDSANGGASHFSIEDATAGRSVFRVFAGARSNALVVDAQGDVGIGTSTPSTDIHITAGDTPTVRLDQDATSGFAPQVWDMAGNETSFFIRDATNGSTLPFRIRPGAPTNSIYIDIDGDVGFGDSSPTGDLDITSSGTQVLVEYEATGGTASVWYMVMDGDDTPNEGISFTRAGTGVREFRLDPNGDLIIAGEITTSGSCSIGCDRVFDADYAVPSIDDHSRLMWANKHLPNVGPTLDGGPFNMSDKVLRMLNELEHAHIYIDQLNQRIEALEAVVAEKG